MSPRRRFDRGPVALQVAMLAPVLLGFILLCIAGGRVFLARQAVDAAAFDAARTASIARTAQSANQAARQTANASLTNRQISCQRTEISVDTRGFQAAIGTPARIRVLLRCQLNLSDVAIPGLPASMTIEARAESPLDGYREKTNR